MSAAEDLNDRKIFEAIATKISKITGVQLGEKQYSLVYSRLSKHLRNVGGMTPSQYWDYLQSHEEEEIPILISLLTTHHTFFFREEIHFDYLTEELPNIVRKLKEEGRKTLRVWCAACSKGQEGYTLAMYLNYHLKQLNADLDYEILFSDVDRVSVKFAENGVYPNSELDRLPLNYRSNHWQRGKGKIANFSKIKNSLKDQCRFETINLIEFNKESFRHKFDIVFCRNVFIYFTLKEFESISTKILANMVDDGLFIIGVSESLMGTRLPAIHQGKSIYRKVEKTQALGSPAEVYSPSPARQKGSTIPIKSVSKASVPSSQAAVTNIMVLQSSVKLSPDIRNVISQIPKCDAVGFDVITNVGDAISKIRSKDADILILDVGCSRYVRKILLETQVKILVAQLPEDSDKEVARIMGLGAKDTVCLSPQKLSFNDQMTLTEKIIKLVAPGTPMPIQTKNLPLKTKAELNLNQDYIIGIGASTGGTEAIAKLFKELPIDIPPIVLVQHIPEFYSKQFADRLNSLVPFEVREAKNGDKLEPGLALVAPGNFHVNVVRRGSSYQVKIYQGEKVSGHIPSVDVLFESLAEIAPKKMIGILLTGMGSDGAEGLLKMKQNGAHTIVQDEASSVVFGMPKAARDLGANDKILPLEAISPYLIKYLKKRNSDN